MKKVGIFYGSTTGTCEDIASRIASAINGSELKNVTELDSNATNYDVLVLGTSTWGDGELQDDWYTGVDVLRGLNLQGKTVAIFGCGDSVSYADTFCNGMKPLYDAAVEAGAIVMAGASVDGYSFSGSTAVIDGFFVGFPVDEINEPDKTDERLAPMISAISAL